jgi:hypothetical protein
MDIGAADVDDDGSQPRIWFDFAVSFQYDIFHIYLTI